ncbi:MAG TPA: hypothetical protein VFH48_16720 [Chloroflexota bacterium]|nr:hypothetical protein [Chloroflexota bacterium]
MLHLLIVLALLLHGIGHAVGFWMAVPSWFAVACLAPGVGFLVGGWGFWQHAAWWPAVLAASAAASLLMLALPTGALRQAPYGSALAFDLIVLFLLVLPWSRRLVAAL